MIEDSVKNTSFALIGGRRIGKSSILLRLHLFRLPFKDFYTLYFDCSPTPNLETFKNARIHNWAPRPPSGNVTSFADLLNTPRSNEKLVLLLDEADKLVPVDRASGWPIFNYLRALINTDRVRIVLSGERALQEAMQSARSPLFNIVNKRLLGPLPFHAVEELVTRPMEQLEIELVDNDAIVRRIYEVTSGHPNVVQRLCHRLIERLNTLASRRITIGDVNAIIETPSLQEEDFLSTFWEAASPLEKVISLVLSEKDKPYRLNEVRRLISEKAGIKPSATATKCALDRLVDLRSILKRSLAGYAFAVKAFPAILAKHHDRRRSTTDYGGSVRKRGERNVSDHLFEAGGSLMADSPVYVLRDADEKAATHLRRMEYITLVEPRQQGKTSLINKLIGQFSTQGFTFAVRDLMVPRSSASSCADWYTSVGSWLSRQFTFIPKAQRPTPPVSASSWETFLAAVAEMAEVSGLNVVIVLDEIGAIPIPWATDFCRSFEVFTPLDRVARFGNT